MMHDAATLAADKAIDEPDEFVAVECAQKDAAGILGGDKMIERHYVKVREPPNFLL
jgi:hypothetical protein